MTTVDEEEVSKVVKEDDLLTLLHPQVMAKNSLSKILMSL